MYGTRVCHHMDESGVIKDGKMIGKRLMIRVMLEDGSMCFFTAITSNNVMDGGYTCMQGGGIIEGGSFRTQRIYY